jgi:hypothetical protein
LLGLKSYIIWLNFLKKLFYLIWAFKSALRLLVKALKKLLKALKKLVRLEKLYYLIEASEKANLSDLSFQESFRLLVKALKKLLQPFKKLFYLIWAFNRA